MKCGVGICLCYDGEFIDECGKVGGMSGGESEGDL